MRRVIQTGLSFFLGVWLMACQPMRMPPPSRPIITPTTAPIRKTLPDAVLGIQQQLTAQLRLAQNRMITIDQLTIVSVEPKTWPNSCLGLVVKDQVCLDILTPGYKVTLTYNDQTYVYHSDEQASYRLAKAPEVKMYESVMIYKQPTGFGWANEAVPCVQSEIGDNSIAFGYCGEPQILVPLPFVEYSEEFEGLRNRFASFTATTSSGTVIFNGLGYAVATPIEQRMVIEWARLVTQAAFMGRSGAGWDFGLGYGYSSDKCWRLRVSITGLVTQNNCDSEYFLPQTKRLDAEQAEQFYAWLDTFKGFEDAQASLAGRGLRAATEQEIKGMYLFAKALLDSFPSTPIPDVHSMKSISPDGKWTAESTTLLPKPDIAQLTETYATKLIVRQTNGGPVWTVVDSQQRFGLGYTMPQPFAWSKDGSALFYTNYPVPDGCAIFVNGLDLYRVDLATGEVTMAAPPVGLWLALSPDENFLAGLSGEQLLIFDLQKKFNLPIKLPMPTDEWMQFGHAVWSPDGKMIALTGARKPCSNETRYDTLLVDVETRVVTTLIENDDHLFVPTYWRDTENVVLQNKDHRWILNMHTRLLKREDQTSNNLSYSSARVYPHRCQRHKLFALFIF